MMWIWFLKLLLAHLISDFVLQPSSWVEERRLKKFAAPCLYYHALVTFGGMLLLTGFSTLPYIIGITVLHLIIDGVKSYLPQRFIYFLLDQLAHLLVILAAILIRYGWGSLSGLSSFISSPMFLLFATAFVWVSFPVSVLIAQATARWRNQVEDFDSLARAGKWIGIIERWLILILVLNNQYEAVGLLIAAKSIIRFNEKDRTEMKTEYLVIGTLLSISLALLTGLALKFTVNLV